MLYFTIVKNSLLKNHEKLNLIVLILISATVTKITSLFFCDTFYVPCIDTMNSPFCAIPKPIAKFCLSFLINAYKIQSYRAITYV